MGSKYSSGVCLLTLPHFTFPCYLISSSAPTFSVSSNSLHCSILPQLTPAPISSLTLTPLLSHGSHRAPISSKLYVAPLFSPSHPKFSLPHSQEGRGSNKLLHPVQEPAEVCPKYLPSPVWACPEVSVKSESSQPLLTGGSTK